MSKIPIPGFDDEKWVKIDTEEGQVEVKFADLIKALIEVAQERGYSDYRKFLMEQVKSFTQEDYENLLTEFADEWEESVMLGKEKPDGGKWNEESTFEEYLKYKRDQALRNLDKVREEKKSKPVSFKVLGQWKEDVGDNFQTIAPKIGESQDTEIYEFYEELIKRSIECIDLFFQGKIRPRARKTYEEEENIKII